VLYSYYQTRRFLCVYRDFRDVYQTLVTRQRQGWNDAKTSRDSLITETFHTDSRF